MTRGSNASRTHPARPFPSSSPSPPAPNTSASNPATSAGSSMRSASPTSSGVTSSASTQKTSPHGSTSTAGLSALLAECHGAAVSAHGFGSLGTGAVVIQISRAPASQGRGLVQVLSPPSPLAPPND